MSANSISTPRPSTTAADRSRAAAKSRPQSPTQGEPKAPKGETVVSKALDGAGLDGAASAARRGKNEVHKAMSRQETREHARIIGAYETARAAGSVAKAAAGDVTGAVGDAAKKAGDAARDTATKVGDAARTGADKVGDAARTGAEKVGDAARTGAEKVGDAARTGADKVGDAARTAADKVGDAAGAVATAAKPVVDAVAGPTVREGREAAREVGKAGRNVLDTARESRAELAREVAEVTTGDAPGAHKAILGAYEIGENVVQGTARQAGSILNAGKEVLEGAGELLVHSPGINAVRAGGEAAVDGVRELAGRTADGAKAAGKAAKETGESIRDRNVAQAEENRREVGEAGRDLARDWVDGLNPLDDPEVLAVTKTDAPAVHRALLGAYEIGENTIQDTGRDIGNAGRLAGEVGEAGLETVVTGARNVGDALAGGAEAVGGFVGGLFGR